MHCNKNIVCLSKNPHGTLAWPFLDPIESGPRPMTMPSRRHEEAHAEFLEDKLTIWEVIAQDERRPLSVVFVVVRPPGSGNTGRGGVGGFGIGIGAARTPAPAHSALNVATLHGVGVGERRQIQIGRDAAAAMEGGGRKREKKE